MILLIIEQMSLDTMFHNDTKLPPKQQYLEDEILYKGVKLEKQKIHNKMFMIFPVYIYIF